MAKFKHVMKKGLLRNRKQLRTDALQGDEWNMHMDEESIDGTKGSSGSEERRRKEELGSQLVGKGPPHRVRD